MDRWWLWVSGLIVGLLLLRLFIIQRAAPFPFVRPYKVVLVPTAAGICAGYRGAILAECMTSRKAIEAAARYEWETEMWELHQFYVIVIHHVQSDRPPLEVLHGSRH